MKIGNLEIKNNVFLAPMAGVTDKPFRILCKEMGCGLVYSEMVSAKGMFYESKNTHKLLESDEAERPVAVQLFGSDPKIMADMAKRLEDLPIDIIDVNMGCPAPKIVRNGEGSALMKTPELVGEIVKALVEGQKKPVTIKFRKG
ncbi:MAG: tRNA-dihydrouridine synthase, partial [Firmicutes bacterium]|nr:tRNA-dihydrouridine synthase [Bacillota bacterium]